VRVEIDTSRETLTLGGAEVSLIMLARMVGPNLDGAIVATFFYLSKLLAARFAEDVKKGFYARIKKGFYA
jgi:hypothetical protein